MELDYFTCTLGEAAIYGKTDPMFMNVSSFIDQQAQRKPCKPAVGFYSASSSVEEPWHTQILSFGDVQRGSTTVADIISRASTHALSSSKTVALLCSSTADFLFTWLGLLRLGHRVLLVAPQLAPPAIAHLCKQCEAKSLLFDEQYQNLAHGTGKYMAAEGGSEFWIFDIATVMGKAGVFDTIKHNADKVPRIPHTEPHEVAFFFHTSGTSTGMPMPIPQSHFAAVGVLPRLDGTASATFTTTPLYHGGIADLFRAWSSDAMIWLFPGKGVPITAANMVRCLETSREAEHSGKSSPIRFFSSVPYVLQMMEQDRQGLQQLQSMAVVGVGGAALPDEVGQRLVTHGVNLISRFGSAECGFLLSSRRYYDHDHGWQYLRDYTQLSATRTASVTSHCTEDGRALRTNGAEELKSNQVLRFEARDDGLSELIVLPAWPHRAKTNRPDGSYATSDLFEPHSSIPNAWRYHSRADAQLTLITGKKFDPAPLEDAIAVSSPSVSDVFIFGDARPYPGALIFRSKATASRSAAEVMEEVWPALQKLNDNGQAHTRLGRHMVTVMPFDPAGLERSSKGTLIRKKISERFATEVELTYKKMDGAGEEVADKDVMRFILDSVKLIHGESSSKELTSITDLYAFGFDSVASIQLRRRLSSLLPDNHNELPFSVVEDCGTAEKLTEYVVKRRHGESIDEEDGEEQQMLDLVETYSNFEPMDTDLTTASGHSQSKDRGLDVVVLTGATGALGAHVLHIYREHPKISKIYCLVRGSDAHAAKERVSKALSQRGLPDLSLSAYPNNHKVEVFQCQLSDRHLGLPQIIYRRLADTATIFVHLAWAVNFRLKLHHFEREHIAGTYHLLNLTLTTQQRHPTKRSPTFLFCSSTASCTGLLRRVEVLDGDKLRENQRGTLESTTTGQVECVSVPEEIIYDPSAASAIGYGRSKWVAEAIVDRSTSSRKGTRSGLRKVAVLRVGQLAGDTKNGIWNTSEAWPMMLKSLRDTGTLPALRNQCLDWLPVDIAAKAVVEAGEAMKRRNDGEEEGAHVMHVLNPNREPTWMDMLGWLKEEQQFEIIEPKLWIEKLERVAKKYPDHPALKLLGLWKEDYCSPDAEHSGGLSFDMSHTREAVPILRNVLPLDREYFQKVWKWLLVEES